MYSFLKAFLVLMKLFCRMFCF